MSDAAEARVAHALATLRRGTTYLDRLDGYRPLAGHWPEGQAGIARGRFVGNCLAEVDRFLHVLMDELAPARGLVATPHQRNTANKIAGLGEGSVAADRVRLSALGRSRACFNRCGGVVRRADVVGGGWMTSGWHGPDTGTLRRFRLGDRLVASGTDLARVGAFYAALGDRLVA